MIELTVDPEFEQVIPPLTDDEFKQLEENIVSEGIVLMPLIIWNGIIIDGHNRYKIIQAHPEVEYRTHEKQFENRYDALSWICKNQLGRRNLTEIQKTILIGKRYEAEKESHGATCGFRGNQYELLVSPQNEDLPKDNIRTAKKIANELGIGRATVERAGKIVQAIGIAESILPGIEREIISSSIKPTKQAIMAIAKASPDALPYMVEQLRQPKPKPSKPSPPPVIEPEPVATIENIDTPVDSSTVVRVTEEDILNSMEGAADSFIATCENHFVYFPKLLTDSSYLVRVKEIMTKPYTHIKNKIKELNA